MYATLQKKETKCFVPPQNCYSLYLMDIHLHLNLCPSQLFVRDLRYGHNVPHET